MYLRVVYIFAHCFNNTTSFCIRSILPEKYMKKSLQLGKADIFLAEN